MSELLRHRTTTAGARARRALLLLLAGVCSALGLAAAAVTPEPSGRAGPQGEPRVAAQLSTGLAKVGEQVLLRVVVEDAEDARLGELPRVEGLVFGAPSRPGLEQGMSIRNGRRTSWTSLSWGIALRGDRPGEYEIPPIAVEVGGRRLETRPLSLRIVRDLVGEQLGFIELATRPAGRVVDGQPFTLELRFGWDPAAEVNYANLLLPWWESLYGAVDLGERELPPGAKAVEGVMVNNRVAVKVEELPRETRDGRSFRSLRLVQSFVATRTGTLEIPSAVLEFGQVRSTLLRQERLRELFVQAPALALEVLPLPAEGQPFDYGGAVGSLTARAGLDARDVRVGDSIKLTVSWTGSGNLEFFDPPDPARLDAFDGFRYYGKTEEKGFDRRQVTYDLAPLSTDVDLVPPLPLPVFDPELGRYTTVTTDAIPIRVRPLEGLGGLAAGEAPSFAPDIRDLDARPLAAADAAWAERAPGDRAVAAALVVVPLAWLALRSGVRRRRGDPGAPLERRRRRARRRLAQDLARAAGPREQHAAMIAFLAARTREDDAAWVGRDGAQGVLGAPGAAGTPGSDGLAPAAAAELRTLLARLDAAVYGGAAPLEGREILETAERLVGAGL